MPGNNFPGTGFFCLTKMIGLLDQLIDTLVDNPDPVKESLIDTLETLIKDYENRITKTVFFIPFSELCKAR